MEKYPLTSAELFDMTMEKRWTCGDCGHVIIQDVPAEEAGHGIGLEVNLQQPTRGLSLVEYLRTNVFEETLNIRCKDSKCKQSKRVSGKPRQRRKLITQTLEVLIVRLVRFAQEYRGASNTPIDIKIRDQCKYEEYLNLSEFTESGDPLPYQLDGVVAHNGKNVGGSHYIAGIREQKGKAFCCINDDVAIE